jgi:site-specific DNA recombinase
VTITEVAQLLNQRGYRTRQTTRFGSRPWSEDTVNGLLRNAFYAGLVKHGEDIYQGQHMAIISRELWEKSVAIRSAHVYKPHSHSADGRVYLLGGLARCDACGEPLRCQPQYGGLTYYRDTTHERGLECPRQTVAVRTDVIDQEMAEIVSSVRLPDSWRERVLDQLQAGDEQCRLEADRKRTEERKRRVTKAYIDGGLTDAEYEREKRALQSRLDQLRNPEVDQVLDAAKFLGSLGLVWEKATRKERRELVRILFDAVYVDIEAKRISGLVAKPVFRILLLNAENTRDLAALCKF